MAGISKTCDTVAVSTTFACALVGSSASYGEHGNSLLLDVNDRRAFVEC